MVGTGKGAEHGILIKSAQALETLHTVDTVVLDKTGTLTQGKPRVTDVLPLGDTTEEELLCVAASLEKPSEHPLSSAIVSAAQEREIPLAPVSGFAALHGKGIRGEIQGGQFLAGNAALLADEGISLGGGRRTGGRIGRPGQDAPLLRPGWGTAGPHRRGRPAQAHQRRRAVKASTPWASGWSCSPATTPAPLRRWAAAWACDEIIAEVLPQDKERQVAALQSQGRKVAMVGDGINDAPALARADVGLAIGAGTDVAIESADIVLMKSDLLDTVTAVELSKSVIRNIKQNLFWAFIYNIIGIPLAAGVVVSLFHVMLSPMFPSAAMSMSRCAW